MHTKLTSKQEHVLEFIQRYIAEHRCAPFIREIQQSCQIASYKSVIDRLNALERKGYIRRTPNKHRAIRVAPKSLELRQLATARLIAAAAPPAAVTAPADGPPPALPPAKPIIAFDQQPEIVA